MPVAENAVASGGSAPNEVIVVRWGVHGGVATGVWDAAPA
jgi:hypothetical protein